MEALRTISHHYLRACIYFVAKEAVWGELEALSEDMQAQDAADRPSVEEALERARAEYDYQYDVCH